MMPAPKISLVSCVEYIASIWNKVIEHHREMTGFIFAIAMIKYAMPVVFYILNKMQDRRHRKRLDENRREARASMEAKGYSQAQIEQFMEAIRIPEAEKLSILKSVKRYLKTIRHTK